MLAAVSRMLVAFILLAGSGSDLARASTCDEGCVSERSVCGLAAKATYAVCRGSCGIPAADAAFRACRRECQSGYGLARVACSNERRETCLQLCDDSSICIDACGEQLRRCAGALGKRGRPCDASLQIDLTSKVHLTTATQVCPRCNNGRC